MNYHWVIENIDKANEPDVRHALKDMKKENERLNRKDKVMIRDRVGAAKMLKARGLFPPDAGCMCLALLIEYALEAENKKLIKVIQYARHRHGCPANERYLPPEPCTCGFEQALKENEYE